MLIHTLSMIAYLVLVFTVAFIVGVFFDTVGIPLVGIIINFFWGYFFACYLFKRSSNHLKAFS